MNQSIDARGKACPIPVIMAKKEIDAGEKSFTVLVDNAIAVQNLTRLGEANGFSVSSSSDTGIYAVVFMQSLGSSQPLPSPVIPAALSQKTASSGWSVLVAREVLGEGDADLGASLMKMFFYTLAASEDLPKALLFINAGVRLVTENEQVIEHLHVLAEKGIEILVCGTCLNFYGLTERLQIGKVSNMYDIIEQMRCAGNLVSL